MTMTAGAIDERRAIEALRAGVPNRAAVRLMGSMSQAISQRFDESLAAAREALARDTPTGTAGHIIEGNFGSGKSHLLSHLEEQALRKRFVVSRISISKETPLFNTDRLFVALMRAAVLPDQNDDPMTAILAGLKTATPEFEGFDRWANSPTSGLSPLLMALPSLLPRIQGAPEAIDQIARLLSGGKVELKQVRDLVRQSGAQVQYPISTMKRAELAMQLMRFVPRLMVAAGYGGWCLLLDEVELIQRYSRLQRGRSYAELARLIGLQTSSALPGVVTVATIIDGFHPNVVQQFGDDQQVATMLRNKGEDQAADLAVLAMDALKKRPMHLTPPDHATLQQTLKKVRDLYCAAYGRQPPDIPVGAVLTSQSTRQYIKSWIMQWDLLRLYDEVSAPVFKTLTQAYNEDPDLEAAGPTAQDDGLD
jgi:hypothetical protein